MNHRARFFYVSLMSVVEIFLFIYPISITADVIALVLQGGGFAEAKSYLLLLLVFALVQAAIFFSINFVNEVLAHRITTDATYQLFESLQFKSQTFHDSKDVGQIMARATGDTRTLNNAISPGYVRSIQVLTTWVIAINITATIHPLLAVATIATLFLYLLSVWLFGKGMISYSRATLVNFAAVSEQSLNSLSGIREIKGFSAETMAFSRYAGSVDQHYCAQVAEGEKGAWFWPSLIVTFYSAGIIAASLYFAFIGQVTIPQVILIAGIISFLREISSNMNWTARMIISAVAATVRIFTLLTEPDPYTLLDGDITFSGSPATIQFDHVSFSYHPDLPEVLHDLSFTVTDGQTVAIVGPPGSGKSTLMKLIQRLYLPSSGCIQVGGHDIQTYSNKSFRAHLTTVEQDIFLFNDTVSNNIRYGRPSASTEEIEYVAQLAQADEFIKAFPLGYETIVGEGGIRLSGGQAQRLSIARALLMNPSLLLIDDGASALDAKTEIKIQKAISQILQTRTTLITTHRLAIIAKADVVIILGHGKVMGIGSHEQLIQENRYYRRLFERHYELPPLQEVL